MQLLDFQGVMFATEVENHAEIKQDVLHRIAEMGTYGFINKEQSLFSTDYLLSPMIPRLYVPAIQYAVGTHNKCVLQELDSRPSAEMKVTEIWYQQYKSNDFHDWHSHPDCTLSNVYFVDLPEDAPKTMFRLGGKEFEVPIKEGMILTFPSYLMHRSPPNKSEHMKTVISYNSQVV